MRGEEWRGKRGGMEGAQYGIVEKEGQEKMKWEMNVGRKEKEVLKTGRGKRKSGGRRRRGRFDWEDSRVKLERQISVDARTERKE